MAGWLCLAAVAAVGVAAVVLGACMAGAETGPVPPPERGDLATVLAAQRSPEGGAR
ncbi:hypothetical protein RM780_04245 [Streptomyces sp. DSM 44917]|uniref:Uncharacterized protein n=1 Tax=Streptomyces boetiae TaxID=3075541 RepID=A0ABU2L4L2_9ACTN|nr:hypothetical protein [Streptomyces sp. DSM 44917]MDT0306173.1 hypothetical protein [Streptomyces sp. DSM 44917]